MGVNRAEFVGIQQLRDVFEALSSDHGNSCFVWLDCLRDVEIELHRLGTGW